MRKTTHALDAKAADAIETLSAYLGVSRAEVVRRCTVAMQRRKQNGQLPSIVESGYSEDTDGRTLRGTSGKDGSLGRAPSLSDLSDSNIGEDEGRSLEDTKEGSPEGDQRRSEDPDGEKSFLDKRIW